MKSGVAYRLPRYLEGVMLLDRIKIVARATNTAFDEAEITPLIEAARSELKLAGILPSKVDGDEPDSLVYAAIMMYVKANFGFNSPDAADHRRVFDGLKQTMALSAAYTVEEPDGPNP